jgi:hypothetical protein
VGVRGIYLNNYIRWDTKAQHELMIKMYDYETAAQTRTFDSYNDIDCFNYSDVHDYIKFLKHGYSKVTDHVCREIRLKRLAREEGVELIKKYREVKPKFLHQFLSWMGMKESAFNFILDLHRNPEIWQRDDEWNWKIKKDWLPVNENKKELDSFRLQKTQDSQFRITKNKRPEYKDDQYILIGKGYYD